MSTISFDDDNPKVAVERWAFISSNAQWMLTPGLLGMRESSASGAYKRKLTRLECSMVWRQRSYPLGVQEIGSTPSDPCLHATLHALRHVAGKDIGTFARTAGSVRMCAHQPLMQSTAPAVHTVPRQLGMTQRTLQRRLLSEGISFEQVVDGLRRDIAQQRLRAPGGPTVLQVEIELGVTDERSLNRAFHRWTGKSPREWRKKNLKGGRCNSFAGRRRETKTGGRGGYDHEHEQVAR